MGDRAGKGAGEGRRGGRCEASRTVEDSKIGMTLNLSIDFACS